MFKYTRTRIMASSLKENDIGCIMELRLRFCLLSIYPSRKYINNVLCVCVLNFLLSLHLSVINLAIIKKGERKAA